MTRIKENAAVKISISELMKSPLINLEQEEYVEKRIIINRGGEEVSINKCNIIGILLDKNEERKEVIIGDKTGRLLIKFFNPERAEKIKELKIGNPVMIIGRPRSLGTEKYLSGEIIKEVSKEWLILRNKELEKKSIEENNKGRKRKEEKEKEEPINQEENKTEEEEKKEEHDEKRREEMEAVRDDKESEKSGEEERISKPLMIIEKISELDKGTGVTIDELEENTLLSIEEIESIVKNLMSEGEIYEIKPGRVKVLE